MNIKRRGFIKWTFYREALEADVLINVPILKRHVITSVTMGFKNMMGLVGGGTYSLPRLVR